MKLLASLLFTCASYTLFDEPASALVAKQEIEEAARIQNSSNFIGHGPSLVVAASPISRRRTRPLSPLECLSLSKNSNAEDGYVVKESQRNVCSNAVDLYIRVINGDECVFKATPTHLTYGQSKIIGECQQNDTEACVINVKWDATFDSAGFTSRVSCSAQTIPGVGAFSYP